MDLSKDLRAAQAALDDAERELRSARDSLDSASAAYKGKRRTQARGAEVERAREAWGLALLVWAHALLHRESCRDRVAAERRTADREVAEHLHLPTTGGRR